MAEDTYSKVTVRTPAGWMLEYGRECIDYSRSKYKDDLDQPAFKRKGVFAGNCTDFDSVHEIELRSNYNGSGPTAFGGAKQWPAVTSRIKFKEGEYQLAAEFARALGEFTDNWLKEQNR